MERDAGKVNSRGTRELRGLVIDSIEIKQPHRKLRVRTKIQCTGILPGKGRLEFGQAKGRRLRDQCTVTCRIFLIVGADVDNKRLLSCGWGQHLRPVIQRVDDFRLLLRVHAPGRYQVIVLIAHKWPVSGIKKARFKNGDALGVVNDLAIKSTRWQAGQSQRQGYGCGKRDFLHVPCPYLTTING